MNCPNGKSKTKPNGYRARPHATPRQGIGTYTPFTRGLPVTWYLHLLILQLQTERYYPLSCPRGSLVSCLRYSYLSYLGS